MYQAQFICDFFGKYGFHKNDLVVIFMLMMHVQKKECSVRLLKYASVILKPTLKFFTVTCYTLTLLL